MTPPEAPKKHTFFSEFAIWHDQDEEEPSLLILSLLFALLWLLVGALFAVQIMAFEKLPASFVFRMALTDWGPWIIASPAVLWLSRRCPIRSGNWGRIVLLHLLISLLIAYGLELTGFLLMRRDPLGGRPPPPALHFLEVKEEEPRHPEVSPSRRMIHARFNVPIYWMLVAVAHAISYHRHSLHRERRALKAEAQLTQARLAALQSQLNPHFLFNTLNVIAQYIRENPDIAERMIESLSSLLRQVLATSETRILSMREELVFIDHYLDLQKMRFAERLKIVREIDEKVLNAKIPTLLLQPLVENAIIHGISRSRAPGTLTLRARIVRENRVCIEISDTGSGEQRSGKPGDLVFVKEGVGVGNTHSRLRASYGMDFFFSFSLAPEGGLKATLEFPIALPEE